VTESKKPGIVYITLHGFHCKDSQSCHSLSPSIHWLKCVLFLLPFSLAAKQAAEKLGYDKKKWDGGKPGAYDDYDWDELTDEQRKAAAILGYDEATWDA